MNLEADQGEAANAGRRRWRQRVQRGGETGDFHQILPGLAAMSIYVVAVNRLLWRRLYRLAETRYAL